MKKYNLAILASFVAITLCATLYMNSISTSQNPNIVGVYWGAFDPPTSAHYEIMKSAIQNLKLKKLIVVVNNSSYKNYTYSLEERKKTIQYKIQENGLKNVEILDQDDSNKINYTYLRRLTNDPLYAIAGYDAYVRWLKYSSDSERNEYNAIIVVPRGDDKPILYDQNAALMRIDSVYRHVSSSAVKLQNASPK